jgi:hypothetical protein
MIIQASSASLTATTIPDFENLTVETCMPGGFTVANFTLHRNIGVPYPDVASYNEIKIIEGPWVLFEGYIDMVSRSINPDSLDVQCLGWSAILNQCGTTADIIVTGAGNNQASDFITNVMFADSDITTFLTAGTIDTSDFAYQAGTTFEFKPFKTYQDCLEEFNGTNYYDYGCWEDKSFFWTPRSDSVDWLVSTLDCSDVSISPNPDWLCNRVIVSYGDGDFMQQTIREDTDSQTKYGRRIIKTLELQNIYILADAQRYGDQYITEHKDLKVTSELTTSRVFTTAGAEVPLYRVRAGDIVKVIDWMPASELLMDVNVTDITTFKIKSTSYDHSDNSLQITPTEPLSQVEIDLARLASREY